LQECGDPVAVTGRVSARVTRPLRGPIRRGPGYSQRVSPTLGTTRPGAANMFRGGAGSL
jgi:hypothetical protein